MTTTTLVKYRPFVYISKNVIITILSIVCIVLGDTAYVQYERATVAEQKLANAMIPEGSFGELDNL